MTIDEHSISEIEDAYPLARLQSGMLFHSEYSPDSAVYHDIFSFHIEGPLDLPALQAAIRQLTIRHAVLRTSFNLSDFSEPLQLIHRAVEIPLQMDDLSRLSTSEQEEALAAWVRAEKSRPFDWKVPPLSRFQVHRRTQKTFQLTFSFHHAILDGWSLASMLVELFQIYSTLRGEDAPPLQPPPSITFRDFVALEREAIASAECRNYWIQKLKGNTISELPRSFSSKLVAAGQIRKWETPLPPEICEGLQKMAKQAGVSIKSVLLAAHLRVLSFISGQTDVLTGLVSNGRPEDPDGERILGLFLNTLPFRLNLAGGPWQDMVRKVFEVEQELLPFRRFPLAEIQRIEGRASLFETAFNFVHFHIFRSLSQFQHIRVLESTLFEETNFVLFCTFILDSSRLFLSLSYDDAKLSDEQTQTIGGYYTLALSAMIAEPRGHYENCSLLSAQERHLLLLGWNDTRTDCLSDKCVHELFEEQAARTPGAIALVFEGRHMTYEQLNRKANQQAHHLRSLGVGPDMPVGIYVERCLEMVIALLAVLKSGGVYLPLDPGYPQERIAFMLQDSKTRILLTRPNQSPVAGRQSSGGSSAPSSQPPTPDVSTSSFSLQPSAFDSLSLPFRTVFIDTDWGAISEQPSRNPRIEVKPENLAYVVYTSGSTGLPKGVSGKHSALVNRLSWMQKAFPCRPSEKHIQKTSIHFIDSITETLTPLVYGAQLHVAGPEIAADPGKLWDFIDTHAINRLTLVPSLLDALLKIDRPVAPTALKLIVSSGEALSCPIVEATRRKFSATRLINLYGSSEVTGDVTCYVCDDLPAAEKRVPIGRPIANIRIYILDAALHLTPKGVTGQLYIGGAGLARGYLNRPEMTAEKFTPDPFNIVPGARLFKTGDRGRWLADGNIEYLGRSDFQVKIRGFRIELGEIETVLTRHALVREAIVLAREDVPGDKRLVAYLVPADKNTPLHSADLRTHLKAGLPEYMIPSAFVMLEYLPRTPNGKLDRKTLPAPEYKELAETYVAPETSTEKTLAKIFSEVLDVARAGAHDSFFELGGHSLLATQVISRVRQEFRIELTLKSLFETPTLSSLARIIDLELAAKRPAEDPALTFDHFVEGRL